VTEPGTLYNLFITDWSYYFADQEYLPGMPLGPDTTAMPSSSDDQVQVAPGCVLIAAASDTDTIAVELRHLTEPPEASPEYPELLGEVIVAFPSGNAQLLALGDTPASGDLLGGRPGMYGLRVEARGFSALRAGDLSVSESHLISLWPDASRSFAERGANGNVLNGAD
jgi:hypothetical protein